MLILSSTCVHLKVVDTIGDNFVVQCGFAGRLHRHDGLLGLRGFLVRLSTNAKRHSMSGALVLLSYVPGETDLLQAQPK